MSGPLTVYSCPMPGCARQKGHVGPCLNRLFDVPPDPVAGLREALTDLQGELSGTERRTYDDHSWANHVAIQVQKVMDAVTASPEPTPGLREALASWVHGDRCTCPYSVEPSDLARADEVLAALAASPEPTGLDADRLRVALKRWLDMATEAGLVGHVPPPEWLAAEYARLGEKP